MSSKLTRRSSLIEHYPKFNARLRASLRALVGEEVETRVDIGMAKDGSGVGGTQLVRCTMTSHTNLTSFCSCALCSASHQARPVTGIRKTEGGVKIEKCILCRNYSTAILVLWRGHFCYCFQRAVRCRMLYYVPLFVCPPRHIFTKSQLLYTKLCDVA